MEGEGAGFVGREGELARLLAALDHDKPVAVVGEAGIGKTSLVRVAAARSGRRLFEGGGFATLRDAPFLALRRAVESPVAGDFSAVARSVEQRVGPELLFVDDLQWADAGTIEALRLLQSRIGLVVAIRSISPDSASALAFASENDLETIHLAGVDEGTARTIVDRTRPGISPAEAARVVAQAGGNPLLLQEIALTGAPTPVLAHSIEEQLDACSPTERDRLELLAILERPVARDLAEGAEDLIGLGFLAERAGYVQIRHALIAEAIRDQLDEPTARALHGRAAALADDPLEKARHLLMAGRPAEAGAVAAEAVGNAPDPIGRAALLVIVAEASGANGPLGPRLAAGAALSAVSDWEAAVRILDTASATGTPEERGERAALLGHALFELGRHDEARRALEQAGEAPPEPGGAASGHLALERAAFMVNVDGALPAALALLDAELEAHPPDQATHHAIRAIAESMRMLAGLPVDIPYLQAAAAGAVAQGAFASAADLARVATFGLVIWKGAEAAADYADDISRALSASSPLGAIEIRAEAVQANLLAGRTSHAVAVADELLELPAPKRARQTATIYRAWTVGLMGLLDEANRALAELEPAVTLDFVGRGWLLAAQADLALWSGMPGRAIELVETLATIPAPIRGAYTNPELTRAWAQFESDLPAIAPSDLLDAPTQAGAPMEALGIRRLQADAYLEAAAAFAEANALWRPFHVPRALMCAWAHGEALRLAGEDRQAIGQLEGALEEAVERRAEVIAVRIRRSLRLAGRRTVAPIRPVEPSRLGLTRRERELLELAGQGLTNAEIARRMGLGRPTVARILSNAMTKLGAGSRGQAVRLVAELL